VMIRLLSLKIFYIRGAIEEASSARLERGKRRVILHGADSNIAFHFGQAGDDEKAGNQKQTPQKKVGRPGGRFLGRTTGHLAHLLCRRGMTGTDRDFIVKKIVRERFDHFDGTRNGGPDAFA
jgi:hypothetical protein